MTTRTVIDCDKCGLETATPVHIDIPNGVDKESGCPNFTPKKPPLCGPKTGCM